jgi:hypothetical protein
MKKFSIILFLVCSYVNAQLPFYQGSGTLNKIELSSEDEVTMPTEIFWITSYQDSIFAIQGAGEFNDDVHVIDTGNFGYITIEGIYDGFGSLILTDDGDKLYLGSGTGDSYIYLYQRSDTSQNWTVSTWGCDNSGPANMILNEGLYVSPGAGSTTPCATKYTLSGGKIREYSTGNERSYGVALLNDTILFGTDGGMLYAYDTGSTTLHWSTNLTYNVRSVFVYNNYIYTLSYASGYQDNFLSKINKSGTLVWQRHLKIKPNIGRKSRMIDSLIVYGESNGNVGIYNVNSNVLSFFYTGYTSSVDALHIHENKIYLSLRNKKILKFSIPYNNL